MKYQLVIQKEASSITEYDAIIELEDEIIELLEDEAEVDGHDFGSSEANIFILTNNPIPNFETIKERMGKRLDEEKLRIAYRDIDTENYIILYPQSLTKFEVK